MRNWPLPSPQTWRTIFAAARDGAARLALRAGAEVALREPQLDDRLAAVGAAREHERGRDAARARDLQRADVRLEHDRAAASTSTVAPYGIVPAVNGWPFTVTVPVVVAVGGAAAVPPPVVVVRSAAAAASASAARPPGCRGSAARRRARSSRATAVVARRDAVVGEADVRLLARPDLDRDVAACRRRDHADLHCGGADGAVVGVDVRAPDRAETVPPDGQT